MIPIESIEEACFRISGYVFHTPVTFDQQLGLFYKWENRQKTGSFKLRGALNKVLSLSREQLQQGLVTCSAGNHGQGVAYAARQVGASCVVYVPIHAATIKVEAMRALGADVRYVNGGYEAAERFAIKQAAAMNKIFISPYNDLTVMAGQGTIAAECEAEIQSFSTIQAILVPVGGGGLICGMASFLKHRNYNLKIIGVQSEASPYACQLIRTGSQIGVVEKESIADGLAGAIAADSLTIPLMFESVDEVILVSEEEIRQAIRYAWNEQKERIEGSAAVGLAAQLAGKIHLSPALTVITGGNIQPELFNEILR